MRSKHLLVRALALTLLGLIPVFEAGAQVLVDDFSTAQSELSVTVPPDSVGDGDSSSQAGGMLGGQRDLVVTFISGSGSVSAEITGGEVVFAVGAMATGNVEATWDGNTDPGSLDPIGLGGADLTTGGASAFRFNAGATTNPVDAVLEVYTDGANASTAALRIPVGAPADLFLAFSELVPSLGSGADLADVGAIVLRLAGADAGATITLFDTVAPGLSATKADTLADDLDADTTADPGDTVTYTVTLTNTGGEALSVDVADTVDANTTLVPGSVSSTPIARGDQYVGFGNVTLTADGTPPRPGLLANDADPDGDAFTVSAVDATSERGGTVTLVDASSGTFEYTPPAGLRGVDTFGYTVSDDDSNIATGTATIQIDGIAWFVDNTNTGCGSPPCGDGTQADPFQTAKQAETASAPGDVIRLRAGDGTSTGYDQGFILKADQRLVGGASDLVLGGSLIEPGAGRSVHTNAAGNVFELASANVISGVRLEPTAGHGLAGNGSANVLAEDVVIYTSANGGGVSLLNHTAGFDFENGMITSTVGPTDTAVVIQGGSGSFDFSGSPIAHDGGGLIHLQGTSGATIDFTGSTPTLTNGTNHGILLDSNTSSTITFDSIGDIATTGGHGIRIATSGTVELGTVGNVSATAGAALDVTGTTIVKEGAPGPITFASLAASNGVVGVNLNGVVPAITVAGSTSVTAAAGISLQASGAVTFAGNLAVTATAGAGLVANNTGLVSVPTATSAINATGGPGVDVTNTPLAVTLQTLTSTSSTSRGLSFSGTSGTLTATGGSITGVPNGNRGISINGGILGLTYGGTVTYTANDYALGVQDTSGGFATFGAKVTATAPSLGILIRNADSSATFADLDLGTSGTPLTSQALTLELGNTGTYAFADTQIFTNGTDGFHADNGGVVEVTGTGNRLTTANGIAVRLLGGTTIGANEVTFERIDAGGSTHGIRLNGAGSGFNVTGVGTTDGSGGTLSNITQRGIEVLGTDDVSFANMTLTNASTTDAAANCDNTVNTGCHAPIHLAMVDGAVFDNVGIGGSTQQGFNGVAVSGLSLIASSILNAGDEVNEGSLRLINLSGTSQIVNSDIGLASERAALIENTSAPNLVLTVDGSTFRDTSAGLGADGLEMAFFGTSTATIDVGSSSFLRNRTNGIQVLAEDTSVVTINVTGSTFMPQPGSGIGLDLATADSGNLTFNVIGNPMIYSDDGPAVNVFAIDTATIEGRINDNPDVRLGGVATAGIGIGVQVNEDARGIVEISGNTISDIGFDAGIRVISRLKAGAACGTTCTAGRLDAIIDGNDVTIDSGGLYDVWVQANDSNTTCANVTNNSGSGAGIAAFRERTNAAGSTVLLQGFDTDATTTWNGNGNTPVGSVSSSNNGTLAGGACATVSHPLP